MLIDTHCHLSSNDYKDIDLVIRENFLAGVSKIIVSGCSRSDIDEVLSLKDVYDMIYASIGYHPDEVDKVTKADLIYLREHLLDNYVVSIGEIGLDYYHSKNNKEKQIELFEAQLKLAEEFNLPVVIHSREATNDTISILKKYKVKGVIHCFSGSFEVANIYIKMGFYLGIGGVVTFKNSKLKEVVRKISLDNIVLETDSPYLTPDPYRGKQNSSKYLSVIANYIAKLKNVSEEDVAKITSNNAMSLFDFSKK